MDVVSFFPFFIIGVVGGFGLIVLFNLLHAVFVKETAQTWYYRNHYCLVKGPFDTETIQRLYMKELFGDTLVRLGESGKWEQIESHYQVLCHSVQWLVVVSSQGLSAHEGPFSNEEMRAKFLAGEVNASTMVNPSIAIHMPATVEAFFPLLSSAFLSDPCHPGECSSSLAFTGKSDQSDVRPTVQLGADCFFDVHTLAGQTQHAPLVQRGSQSRKTARRSSGRQTQPKSRGKKKGRSSSGRWPAADNEDPQHWPAVEEPAPQTWPAAEEASQQLWPAGEQSTGAECWPAGRGSDGSWPVSSQSLSSSASYKSEDVAMHNQNPDLCDSVGTPAIEDQLERGVGQPTDETKSAWSRGREYVETVVKPVLERGLEKGREYVETGQAKIQERLAAPPPQPLGNSDDEEGDPEMSQSRQFNDPADSALACTENEEVSAKYGVMAPQISNFGPLPSHKPQPNAGSAAPPPDKFGWSSFGPVAKK